MNTRKLTGYGWPVTTYKLDPGVYEFDVLERLGHGDVLEWAIFVRITAGPLEGHRLVVEVSHTPEAHDPDVYADLDVGVRFSCVLADTRSGFGIVPDSVRISR